MGSTASGCDLSPMRRRRVAMVAPAFLAAAVALGTMQGTAPTLLGAGWSQAAARAGVVVQFPDGTVKEACVDLPDDATSGIDLLRLAGFAAIAEVSALGATVCTIDGAGCGYPDEPCWCQCRSLGDACTYWVYHQALEGRWQYSSLGASDRRVESGDVDGWAWGSGGEGYGADPPFRAFADVCAQPATPQEEDATPDPSSTADSAIGSPSPMASSGDETSGGEVGGGSTEAEAAAAPLADAARVMNPAAAEGAALVGAAEEIPTFRVPGQATLEAMRTALAHAAVSGSAAPDSGNVQRSTPGAIALLAGTDPQMDSPDAGEVERNGANRAETGWGYALGALLIVLLTIAGRAVGRRGRTRGR